MGATPRPAPPAREVKRTNYVDIDVGKKRCAACATDEKGSILRELICINTRSGIESFAETLTVYGECSTVLESTGNIWLKTYEILEVYGIKVKLANLSKNRTIANARIKTDHTSSRALVELLRVNGLPESYFPPPHVALLR
jgi:transposase